MTHLLHSENDARVTMNVTPRNANWDYLSFRVLHLKDNDTYIYHTGGDETALVPLVGSGDVRVGGETFAIARKGVFEEMPHILYVPPNQTIEITATPEFELALGGAPADGKYPLRLFAPKEMKSEMRGGGAAERLVNHVLAYPLPAERLILFEVYVPGGAWSGYPPHCHDRYGDSPYLEETYYFRTTPEDGFAFHRNYRIDKDFDETFAVGHKDLVLVTEGFHSTAAAPGTNVYFLNYLAGELLDEARATPPYDDPRYAWYKEKWEGIPLNIPEGKG